MIDIQMEDILELIKKSGLIATIFLYFEDGSRYRISIYKEK